MAKALTIAMITIDGITIKTEVQASEANFIELARTVVACTIEEINEEKIITRPGSKKTDTRLEQLAL